MEPNGAMAIYPIHTDLALKWDWSWPRALSHVGGSPKAARRSPTPGNASPKVARDASKDGGSRGVCSRRAQGSLQNSPRLESQTRMSIFAKPKLMGPHQEMNPRITGNDTKLSKKILKRAWIQILQENSFQMYRCSALRFSGGWQGW